MDTFPSTIVLDDFNRSNTGPPPSTKWTTGILRTTGLKVTSNQCGATSAADGYWNLTTFLNPEAYATFDPTAGFGVALWGRVSAPGFATINGYRALFQTDGSILVHRYDAGVSTSLGSTSGAITSAQYGLRILVDTIYIFKDGVIQLTIVDTTYSAAGYIGAGVEGNATPFDNFGGGTVEGGLSDLDSSTFPKYVMRPQ